MRMHVKGPPRFIESSLYNEERLLYNQGSVTYMQCQKYRSEIGWPLL